MSVDSRLSGFHRLGIAARVDALVASGVLDHADGLALKSGRALLPVSVADKMIENVVGTFTLPFAIAPNFRVNGVDRLVPMVVEEPSIVAGLSGAAKLMRVAEGISVESHESLLAGQIQLVDVADLEVAALAIERESSALLAAANEAMPKLVARGGGARELELHRFQLPDGRWTIIVHVLVDTRDAMGANAVNSLCETLAPALDALTGGRSVLKILSNLADRSVFRARAIVSPAALETAEHGGEAVRDGIVLAAQTANVSVHRAATHNKGIMNGIDPVAIATGNDWRAIEAGAHAYAARAGAYRALSQWQVTDDGQLAGTLEIPLKIGIVGGSLSANPCAQLGLKIAGTTSAMELAEMMAAVGLAQNLAALRALVTHGIQRGHMRLHARSVAATAGVPEQYFAAVVEGLLDSGEVKVWKAKELHAAMTVRAPSPSAADDAGHGTAYGKVILLGEHAVVYGRDALALPLPRAVEARVLLGDAPMRLTFSERGQDHDVDLTAGHGVAAALRLILRKLGLGAQDFHVRVESRIPLGMGLGASAAFAVAIIRAFDHLLSLGLDNRAVDQLAFECEKLAHGTPSGIDNNLATYGEPVLFSKGSAHRTKPLELVEPPPIVVASSGVRGSTRAQVDGVRGRRQRNVALYDMIFDEIGEISAAGAVALREADYETLGPLMNVCQGLLNAIEVSTPDLERMIDIARHAGALGAKLTGAGGGGSIVALCPEREEEVAQVLTSAGYAVIRLRLQSELSHPT